MAWYDHTGVLRYHGTVPRAPGASATALARRRVTGHGAPLLSQIVCSDYVLRRLLGEIDPKMTFDKYETAPVTRTLNRLGTASAGNGNYSLHVVYR
jgi:hypothetical protein